MFARPSVPPQRPEAVMAKSKQTLIKMVSTADSGYFYVTT
jgi:hypothetical protein